MRVCLCAVALVGLVAWMGAAAGASWLYVLEGTLRQETSYVYRVLLEPQWGVTTTLPLLRETHQPWYTVRVEEQDVVAALAPSSEWVETDGWSNRWQNAYWSRISEETALERRARVVSEALYAPVHTTDPYPVKSRALSSVPREALAATSNVQKDDPAVTSLARAAVSGCGSQLEAVARLLALVGERVVYACSADLCDPVYRVDAAYTLQIGKGNCVSYAHLALALLRAAGIPAMMANGFVADREKGHAGHAWVSVYFPSWGWVEFESADWMPAYGMAPRTFRMPQHVTAFVGEARGLATTEFSEEHEVAFSILEWPTRTESVAATCRPGETVAWSLSVEAPGSDPATLELRLEGVPAEWNGTLSSSTVELDDNPKARGRDVLVAFTSPAAVAAGQMMHAIVRATSAGAEVGMVTLMVTVAP